MIDIIYEDKDKIIVNKPSGQLSQSGKGFDLDVVSEVLNYRRIKKEEIYAAIINRLDRPVSGLVLLAKNKNAAAYYSRLMQQGKHFYKQYHALICGKPDYEKGEFVDYICHDKVKNTAYISGEDDRNAKEARLTYETISHDDKENVSLVKINLITGRFHQIRIQFASRGHTLVGDYKYVGRDDKTEMDRLVNAYQLKRNEIALCASSIIVDGKKFEIEPKFIR